MRQARSAGTKPARSARTPTSGARIAKTIPGTPAKTPTGISGFDEITRGGLPQGRTTLLMGGPGSGKTVMALQFLAHGARECKEPGIFVAFEEASKRIEANAASFGWQLPQLRAHKKLVFIDAQPKPDLVQAGEFDLCGLLAALEVQIRLMKAKRIVFDALDVMLALLPDPVLQQHELYRLHDWLLTCGITAIITTKDKGDDAGTILPHQRFGFMQFMVDCAVILNHQVVLGVSQRNLRVLKYRGSGFDENESPFLIVSNGLQIAVARTSDYVPVKANNERISSGLASLDAMLDGGYYRGATVLITGFSGTAKTTLSGTFAEAACRRGERTMFVSFDTDSNEVIRNLGSVNIQLKTHLDKGILKMISARIITGSAETYLQRIKNLAKAHGARCLVIDPLSTWYKSGNDLSVQDIADRLIDWAKCEGITLICTSLLDEMSERVQPSNLQISTLADTWIHLSYLTQAGERNRGLSIMKSRGTAHSNQLRELILSDQGVALTNIYTEDGKVLMGTLRREKEQANEASMKALQSKLVPRQNERNLLDALVPAKHPRNR